MFRLKFGTAGAFLALAIQAPLLADLSPEAGSFSFQTYSPKSYGASPQNWTIVQDSRGVLYFGNTDGVLEYDGETWRRIPLDNRSGAPALAVDSKGAVYVGGQGTFGYLRPDSSGTVQFVSLVDRLPKADRQFGDVWSVLPRQEGVYFSSDHHLFLIPPEGPAKIWSSTEGFGRVVFSAFGKVYISSSANGVLSIENGRLVPCSWGDRFLDHPLAAAFSSRNLVLLASARQLYRLQDNSLQPLPTSADSYLLEHKIYSLSRLPNGEIAIGTKRGGLVLLNTLGEIDRVVKRTNGLPSEFVTALYVDRQSNAWITTDRGIAQFEPALTRFGEPHGIRGSVYAIGRLGGSLYAGTTVGLYKLRVSPEAGPVFEPVNPIRETVWVIVEHEGFSLVAAQHGLYSISAGKVTEILPTNLIYDITFSPSDPNVVYTAGRDGILVLRHSARSWETIAQEKGSGQDFRTVAEDQDGRLWATTRVDIWRIDLRSHPAKIERFDAAQGVPAGWKNVYRFRDHIVFATEKGLMRFSDSDRRFVPDTELGQQFADGTSPVSLVRPDAAGNIWITGDGYHGVLRRQASGDFQWHAMPLLGSGIEETWALHVDPDGTAWASGAEGALFRWNPHGAGDPNRDFQVLIRRVNVGDRKSTLFGGAGILDSSLKLPYRDNALRFEFTAPFYQNEAGVQYQVWLEGSEREWSPWTLEARKDYTNLPPHRLKFHVRARNPHGVISQEAVLSFRILPPWYRTWWAYSLYIIGLFLAAWETFQWRVQILKAQNRRLEEIVEERTIEVRAERDQNEALLLNILPAPVASELRDNGAVTPMAFDDVTVCFSDFVGFTLSSEKLPADELVSALNAYFTAFDEIMGRYGLEKLKTIGDSYMFVSGLPERRASHAVDAVLAALEMVHIVRLMARPEKGVNWKIRMGLYSGPVVAGVVGKRKFAFDVWGNTVNFASRMESSGAPNRVNLSVTTCNRIQDFIQCEPRGRVRIKEGREMEMQFAIGPKPELLRGPIVDGIPAAFREQYKAAFHHSPRAFPEFLLVSEALAVTSGNAG